MKIGGGHFAPKLGGQFELESGGHFKLELGGQYHWNLHQVHRTFYEICARKSERAKFLNTLKENLLKRIEQSDK